MAETPLPPENPFANSNGDGDAFSMPEDAADLGQATPNVAAKPGRVMLVLGIVGSVLVFLLYSIFFSGEEKLDVKPIEREVAAPLAPPPLPQQAAMEMAPPPLAIVPPSIPEPTNVKIIEPRDDSAEKAQAQARLRSGILVKDDGAGGLGGGLLGGDSKTQPNSSGNADPNSVFANSIAQSTTEADRVNASRIGDLNRTIAQGRIIQATMESALNTDLPAPIRAIVSRDTYAESGLTPLIPKGSRLIGTYNTSLGAGQSRVFVVWTRVIRPDGVDVMLNSPLVDQIGQAGVSGQVDTKFQDIFSRAILSSVVSIAFANLSDEVSGGSTTTTNNGNGATTTGDAATTATIDSLNRLGAVTDGFLQRFINVQPTILVDQGTPVNVFVNRDLIFSGDTAGPRIIN